MKQVEVIRHLEEKIVYLSYRQEQIKAEALKNKEKIKEMSKEKKVFRNILAKEVFKKGQKWQYFTGKGETLTITGTAGDRVRFIDQNGKERTYYPEYILEKYEEVK